MYTKEEVQEHLEYLTENPKEIWKDWISAKPLFAFVGQDTPDFSSGCLTMIRNNGYSAIIKGNVDEELTHEIINDRRIPTDGSQITVEHLPVFAEWQNRIIDLQNA